MKLNKKIFTYLIYIFLILTMAYFVFRPFLKDPHAGHKVANDKYKEYTNYLLYPLNINVTKKGFSETYYKESDDITIFWGNKMVTSIWNFKNTNVNEVHNIKVIKKNTELNLGLDSYEILKTRANREIYIKNKYDMGNGFQIILNNKSRNITYKEEEDYLMFFGNIDKMAFEDSNGDQFVLFQPCNDEGQTFVLVFCKNNNTYVFIIEAKVVSEKFLDFLNLPVLKNN